MQSFIKNLSRISSLQPKELTPLIELGFEKNHQKGAYIFHQGQFCCCLAFVKQGKVKIVKHSPKGKDSIIDMIYVGDIFAAAALMAEKPLPASAIATEKSAIFHLPKESFQIIRKDHPIIFSALMNMVSCRLIRAWDLFQSMAIERVEVRLAKRLLRMHENLKPLDIFHIEITRKELSEMVGTTVETTIRVLSNFKKLQFIETNRGTIHIVNPESLQALINK